MEQDELNLWKRLVSLDAARPRIVYVQFARQCLHPYGGFLPASGVTPDDAMDAPASLTDLLQQSSAVSFKKLPLVSRRTLKKVSRLEAVSVGSSGSSKKEVGENEYNEVDEDAAAVKITDTLEGCYLGDWTAEHSTAADASTAQPESPPPTLSTTANATSASGSGSDNTEAATGVTVTSVANAGSAALESGVDLTRIAVKSDRKPVLQHQQSDPSDRPLAFTHYELLLSEQADILNAINEIFDQYSIIFPS